MVGPSNIPRRLEEHPTFQDQCASLGIDARTLDVILGTLTFENATAPHRFPKVGGSQLQRAVYYELVRLKLWFIDRGDSILLCGISRDEPEITE
jgi:hypothetical protein